MTKDTPKKDLAEIAERAVVAVVSRDRQELEATVHADAVNHEAHAEPPEARGQGPAAFFSTAEWLGEAFSDLEWTTERNVVDGDVVVTYGYLSGRHSGPFTVWTADADIERVFVPTGRTFRVRQAHFQRLVDGKVAEHWAVRDDQGMAHQCGWLPPTPAFLMKCGRATSRARKTLARNRRSLAAG
jgi:predicted ester cyclase